MVEKNAVINARLIDLLNILDMRSQVSVFEMDGEDNSHGTLVFDSCIPVYKLVDKLDTDDKEIRKYRGYEVVGVIAGLTTNILIQKGERYYV